VAAPAPANRRPWLAGRGRRATGGSPRPNSWSRLGQRDHRREWSAEQGGDRRESACSGEVAANACQPAAQTSSVGACGGDVGPSCCGEVRKREFGCGRPWWLSGGARGGDKVLTRARDRSAGFKGVCGVEAFTSMRRREVRWTRHRNAAGIASGSGERGFGATRTSGRHAWGAGSKCSGRVRPRESARGGAGRQYGAVRARPALWPVRPCPSST
jgi:hypothetical protein